MTTPRQDPTLSNDPQPAQVAGLTDGGSIVAGDTPPGEDSISGAVSAGQGANHGPVAGNRTPMIITLTVLALVVLSVIGYGIAELVSYTRL